MRWLLGLVGGCFACAALAGGGTLRVGSQVLVAGDSAARVIELLGKPDYRAHGAAASSGHASGKKGSRKSAKSTSSPPGEQWQYRQGNRLVTIVVANGKVTSIRDDGR